MTPATLPETRLHVACTRDPTSAPHPHAGAIAPLRARFDRARAHVSWRLRHAVLPHVRALISYARRALRRPLSSDASPVKWKPRPGWPRPRAGVVVCKLAPARTLPFLAVAACFVHLFLAMLPALHLRPVRDPAPSLETLRAFVPPLQSRHPASSNLTTDRVLTAANLSALAQLPPRQTPAVLPRPRKLPPDLVVLVPAAGTARTRGEVRLRPPGNLSFVSYGRVLKLLASARERGLLGNFRTDRRFLIYRALGNDLPPRHTEGQVYTNVRFILDHEPRYPDLDRRWYVNRIVNESELARVLDLLVSRNETFVYDHFNRSAYESVDFDFAAFEHPDILRSPTFSERTSKTVRRLVTDTVFKTKNQFIVHNNQARNAMLDLGVGAGATFVLPWDGNCYLTPSAWRDITTAIETTLHSANVLNQTAANSTHPSVSPVSLRYFYVPMQRMTQSNDRLLNLSYIPTDATEEPQVIFHRDANERFDEFLPYGCGPKVDLLYRLRIPGVWTAKARDPYSCFGAANRALSTDVPGDDSVLPAGWTARLFSGVRHLEVGGANRGFSRTMGVERICALATLSIARHSRNYSSKAPLIYPVDTLQKLATYFHHPLRNNSDPALIKSILTAARAELASNQSQRSFESVTRDAAVHALAAIIASLPASLDRSRQLVLACVTRDASPDVRLSGAVCSMLDTARLLRLSGGFSTEDEMFTRRWVYRRLDALEQSKPAKIAYFQSNADGVHFELMTACLAAYYGDFTRVVRATGLAKARLRVQIADRMLWADGFDDGVDGLVAWATLAVIAERGGEDIWSFGSKSEYGGTALLPTAIKSAVVEGLPKPLINNRAVRTHHALQALACVTARVAARSNITQWPADHPGSGRECAQSSVALADDALALPPFWNLEWLLANDNLAI